MNIQEQRERSKTALVGATREMKKEKTAWSM